MFDQSIPFLFLSSQASTAEADRQLRRRCERGELRRIRAGVYVKSSDWATLSYDDRYRTKVHAASKKLMLGTQFSHDSAVVAWHLPGFGSWPTQVHTLSESTGGGMSSTRIARHSLGLDRDAVTINRAIVTSLTRTTLDYARSTSFIRAVIACDAAMAPPEPGSFRAVHNVPRVLIDDVVALMDRWDKSSAGMAKARLVLRFSDGRSGSPGESVSRVQFYLLGFPPPELQVPFFDSQGFIGYADFYWPELDLIGEFDGDVKYLGSIYRRGQLPEDVVLAEKKREDRMRRVVRSFVRWDWPIAIDQRKLVERVMPYGLIALR
jgi:hypothetical protein